MNQKRGRENANREVVAIAEGHGDVAGMLIRSGADLTREDKEGRLAIDLAPDAKVSLTSDCLRSMSRLMIESRCGTMFCGLQQRRERSLKSYSEIARWDTAMLSISYMSFYDWGIIILH